MMMQKPLAVFGLGISNLSVIKALAKDRRVLAWDDNQGQRDKAAALGAEIMRLDIDVLRECECLVLAPGVPLHFPEPNPVVLAAREAGIEIICDIELRYRMGWACRTIGITGTNGKSTTTALTGHVLNDCGADSAIGGNIGVPIFDLAIPGADGVLVLELSSYQLDLCPSFKPDIAVLLNLTPDHLDRHGDMDRYAAAKTQMFEGAGVAVVTGEDEYSQGIIKTINTNAERVLQNLLVPSIIQETDTLKGAHNVQNMMASYAALIAAGLEKDLILSAFKTFPGLPHRQFLVRNIGDVAYVNDSKATNAEATSKALGSFEDIYWILGGLAKDGGLNGLEPFLPRIKKAFVIGEDMDVFVPYLDKHGVEYALCGVMSEAVAQAHQAAQAAGGGVVLLSPATASFDQYKNFELRGDDFVTVVEGL